MEFAQLHSTADVGGVTLLHEVIPGSWLHRRAEVGVAVRSWRPADVFAGAIERVVWTTQVEAPNGVILSDLGIDSLSERGAARRTAPVHPVEAMAERVGEGLVAVWSDAGKLAYCAVYRQRRFAWSLMLRERRLVRSDGQVVIVDDPVRRFPEVDAVGVLIAGFEHWTREGLPLAPAERLLLPDTLGGLCAEMPLDVVIADGQWIEDPPRLDRAARAG